MLGAFEVRGLFFLGRPTIERGFDDKGYFFQSNNNLQDDRLISKGRSRVPGLPLLYKEQTSVCVLRTRSLC